MEDQYYEQKYLKYKKKYLYLKKEIGGGNSNTDQMFSAAAMGLGYGVHQGVKASTSLAQHTANSVYRKVKCNPLLTKTYQDDIKNIIANLLKKDKNNIIKKQLGFNIIKKDESAGIKLSKTDRFKDNISFLIQVFQRKLGITNDKDYTSYADRTTLENILKELNDIENKINKNDIENKINKNDIENKIDKNDIEKKIDKNDIENLKRIRGMIDCYCKSIVNLSDNAQMEKLKQCLPENFFVNLVQAN
jgi:hypothetical protein